MGVYGVRVVSRPLQKYKVMVSVVAYHYVTVDAFDDDGAVRQVNESIEVLDNIDHHRVYAVHAEPLEIAENER